MSMVGSVPRVRAMDRVRCLGRFTVLKGFRSEFACCFDVRVSEGLWLRLSIWFG